MVSVIVYVLAPDDKSLEHARTEYAQYPWARPILLPQTCWLESYMYVSWLMQHRDEWINADFVGTIAWGAANKQPRVHDIQSIADDAHAQGSDLVALLYRGDPLVPTAEHYHPGFTVCWLETWKALGYTDPVVLLHPLIKSFYCNYWMASPQLMERYCNFMAFLDFKLSVDQRLKAIVWSDSRYQNRGPDIAKMPLAKKEELFGVAYYPQIVFVAERLICVFAALYAGKMYMVR
jgi:hypothetical protein